MRRRIAAVAALLSALILAPDCSSKAPANASGMNLLVITLDTTRADAIGLYGNTHAVSPGSTLGRTRLVAEACLHPAPLTLPAHCSLFTGRYPIAHRVRSRRHLCPAAVGAHSGRYPQGPGIWNGRLRRLLHRRLQVRPGTGFRRLRRGLRDRPTRPQLYGRDPRRPGL